MDASFELILLYGISYTHEAGIKTALQWFSVIHIQITNLNIENEIPFSTVPVMNFKVVLWICSVSYPKPRHVKKLTLHNRLHPKTFSRGNMNENLINENFDDF